MSQENAEGMTYEDLLAKYRKLAGSMPMPALEGIDQVDWSKLSHAHGEASDFPVLLLATFSDDRRDRRFAFQLLFETIWHQGTVYEASAHAVPFLFRALESPAAQDKRFLAVLLACLADGHSYLQVHATRDEKSKMTWRQILAKKNQELETQIAIENEYVQNTRRAVGRELPLLYPFLQDEQVAADLAGAFALYPERQAELIPLLEIAERSTHAELAREQIHAALVALQANPHEVRPPD